jgi:hypothetical protein
MWLNGPSSLWYWLGTVGGDRTKRSVSGQSAVRRRTLECSNLGRPVASPLSLTGELCSCLLHVGGRHQGVRGAHVE